MDIGIVDIVEESGGEIITNYPKIKNCIKCNTKIFCEFNCVCTRNIIDENNNDIFF